MVARLRGYGVRIRDLVGRKEGDRVDTGSGQRKAPQGEPYGARGGGLAYLSAVASEGRKEHETDEEGRKEKISKGAE